MPHAHSVCALLQRVDRRRAGRDRWHAPYSCAQIADAIAPKHGPSLECNRTSEKLQNSCRPGIPMPQQSVSSPPTAGAGVLDLLRQFASDPAAASIYGEDCLKRTLAIEPQLKAFEYLPRDVTAKTGQLGGIPVAIKDNIATSDMPTTNG